MGFRMYIDTYPEGFAESNGLDNVSGKLYGYSYTKGHEPLKSYIFLQELYASGKLIADEYDIWPLEDFEAFNALPGVGPYILCHEDFCTFINFYNDDFLECHGQKMHDPWFECIEKLKSVPGNKCIFWI